MNPLSKKQVRAKVEEAVVQTIEKLEITKPSKKNEKDAKKIRSQNGRCGK